MTERFTGKVVWFNEKRGYGFLTPDVDCNNGKDLFVHYSQIEGEVGKFKTVSAGAVVSFVVGSNDNGPQAEKIVVLENE